MYIQVICSVLISIFTVIFIEGELKIMDSTIIAAIISAVVALLLNFIAEIAGWKSVKKLIGQNSSGQNLISQIGIESNPHSKSLSAEHNKINDNLVQAENNLNKSIEDSNTKISQIIIPQTEILNKVKNKLEYEELVKRNFDEQSFNLNNAVKEINLILEKYNELLVECRALKSENEQFMIKTEEFVRQNNSLQEKLTQLSDDNRKLKEELKSVKAVSRKLSNEPKKKNNVQSGSYDIPADDLNKRNSRGR